MGVRQILKRWIQSRFSSLPRPGVSGARIEPPARRKDSDMRGLALQAAGFDVDGVRHGEQHVHVRRAAAVAGHFHAERVGQGADLHPLRDAAGPPVIGLDDVAPRLFEQLEKLYFVYSFSPVAMRMSSSCASSA